MSNVTNSTSSATDVNLAFNHVLIDIAFSLTIIISLIANTTAIYILYERNKQNTRIINFLLKNLSSANILSAIGIIPLTLSRHIKPLINETNDTIICNFIQGTSFFITSGVSLLTLCVISYSRYSSLDSMRRGGAVSKTKVKIACALVWLISVILLIPSYQTYSNNLIVGYKLHIFCPSQYLYNFPAFLFDYIFDIYFFVKKPSHIISYQM